MNKDLGRLVCFIAVSASIAVLPQVVYANHSPSCKDDATRIVHNLRLAGEPKKWEDYSAKKGHNKEYFDCLTKQLTGRIGHKYSIIQEDDDQYMKFRFDKK